MKRSLRDRTKRRGAVAPLAAFLLIPILAMVAFAVDLGWITHTHNELQSAADAAALAGAGKLSDGFVPYYLPGQSQVNKDNILAAAKTAAATAAKNYALYNSAGDVPSLVLQDSDIEFGFTDANGNYTALPTYTGYPNTVKVLLRRDSQANGTVNLFFAPVIGTSSVTLTAPASATIQGASVDSFQANPGAKVFILPMTYDVNHWNNFLSTGQGPDGTTSFDSNGYPQLQVYPSLKFTGNFGLLSLDQGNDGASTISDWIKNGVGSADLQQEVNTGLLPLSKHDSSLAPDWKGNPGLKTSDIHAVNNMVGTLYFLPLFKPVNDGSSDPTAYQAGSGNGSHYYYTIVQFVGVKITQGDNQSVMVQPTSLLDPNAILTSVTPATPPTQNNSLPTVFAAPKLTQ